MLTVQPNMLDFLTAIPKAALDITGDGKVSGNFEVGGNLTVTGSYTCI